MDYNTVSFPGLGIGEFTINPTAFKITDNITIEWYAIIICVGILAAYFVCDRLCPKFGIKGDDIIDAMLVGLPLGFLGARVWYILGDLDSFDNFIDMISVWNGGLAIYGGVFGAFIAAVLVCRHKKISLLSMLDLVSIGFMIGQIIGRWGNFANVEVFGIQTDLPWRMGVGVDCVAEYVHPLFLYESIWNLIGLLGVFAYMDFRKYKGELFLIYCGWYGIGRAWMESLRDVEYNLHIFGLRINMVLAIVLAIASALILIFVYVKRPAALVLNLPREEDAPEYEAQFAYAVDEDLVETSAENIEEANDVSDAEETEKVEENGNENH